MLFIDGYHTLKTEVINTHRTTILSKDEVTNSLRMKFICKKINIIIKK